MVTHRGRKRLKPHQASNPVLNLFCSKTLSGLNYRLRYQTYNSAIKPEQLITIKLEFCQKIVKYYYMKEFFSTVTLNEKGVTKPLGYIFYFSIEFGSFQNTNKGCTGLPSSSLLLQGERFLLIAFMCSMHVRLFEKKFTFWGKHCRGNCLGSKGGRLHINLLQAVN